MILARNDDNRLISDFVYQTMFIIDAARPVTFKFVFERFRLAESRKRLAKDIHNQINNALIKFLINRSPLGEIFEGAFLNETFLIAIRQDLPSPYCDHV